MAASDHLSPGQFLHGSPHQFNPGDVLTREGAWRAKQKQYSPDITNEQLDQRAARYRSYHFEEPRESHLYYADHTQLGDVANIYAAGGGHMYAVQPETASGRKINKHSPDPHYRDYGGGAYRTTGRLRVLHEIDANGNRI